jgi:hypothetical protein
MDGLHIKIISDHDKPGARDLILPKAGIFTATIQEYEDESDALKKQIVEADKTAAHYAAMALDKNLPWLDRVVMAPQRRKENEQHSLELQKQLANLQTKYADVRWICGASERPHYKREDYNRALGTGMIWVSMNFPKVLEGGGRCYMEPYFYGHSQAAKAYGFAPPATMEPKNYPPHGCYISATGTPKIIAAQWKDKEGNPINETVAFGSTVYLHIFTEALYGQTLYVYLTDTHLVNSTPLTLTESDADGQPVERLDPKTYRALFAKPVKVYSYSSGDPNYTVPADAITGMLVHAAEDSGDKREARMNIQKCVFGVFVEHKWQWEGSGSNATMAHFDFGKTLEIHPTVVFGKDGSDELDNCVLTVSREGATYKAKELTGNSPVVISDNSTETGTDKKKRKDITVGVFIDGTMNNRYNSRARISWEKKRLGEDSEAYSEAAHLRVYAKSEEDVFGTDKFEFEGENYEYKYGEGSYENDPSNPAILFEHYDKNESTAKVYVEGIGTETLADENGKVESYESDSPFRGPGLGWGETGIKARVKRAVELTVGEIFKKLESRYDVIGTLTIDVFGFSRGAASARHFVHEITKPSGRNLSSTEIPSNGLLGEMLTAKEVTFDKLVFRFAGLFDTVAHYGLSQSDDIDQLDLNAITRAKHILHITGNDEHRANFHLSRIPKSSNHIELNLPGVHSDIGGGYIEGRPEGTTKDKRMPQDPDGEHILDADQQPGDRSRKLEAFKSRLIEQGWYTVDQLTIHKFRRHFIGPGGSMNYFKLLSYRSYISNQYSFIPLHLMANYAARKELLFDLGALFKAKNFNENIIPQNVEFLKGIEARFEEYLNAVVAGAREDPRYEIKPVELKKLRNNYLHYNATVSFVNAPDASGERSEVHSRSNKN